MTSQWASLIVCKNEILADFYNLEGNVYLSEDKMFLKIFFCKAAFEIINI